MSEIIRNVFSVHIFGNPVFRRETRTAFRASKMFFAVMIYALVLLIAAAIAMSLFTAISYNGFNPQNMVYLYITLSSFQNFLSALIVPALAGGAISGERERQTLDLMLITKMSTITVILGKLAASILIVLMMMTASLPVFAMLLYFGGVSLWNLLGMTLFTIAFSVVVGSISILFSAITKRTILSIVLTYITLLLMTIGNIVFAYAGVALTIYNNDLNIVHYGFIYLMTILNPIAGFVSVLEEQVGLSILYDMLSSIYSQATGRTTSLTLKISIWFINGLFGLMLTAGCTMLAAFFIQPTRRRS